MLPDKFTILFSAAAGMSKKTETKYNNNNNAVHMVYNLVLDIFLLFSLKYIFFYSSHFY